MSDSVRPQRRQPTRLPSLGFSRQEHWSGLPFPSPGDLPNPRIQLVSPDVPALQVDSLPLSHRGRPGIRLYKTYKQKQKDSSFCSVQFSRSVVSDSLQPHGLQHARPACPSPTPGVGSNSYPFTLTFQFHALEKEMATHSNVLAWRIPGTGAW